MGAFCFAPRSSIFWVYSGRGFDDMLLHIPAPASTADSVTRLHPREAIRAYGHKRYDAWF